MTNIANVIEEWAVLIYKSQVQIRLRTIRSIKILKHWSQTIRSISVRKNNKNWQQQKRTGRARQEGSCSTHFARGSLSSLEAEKSADFPERAQLQFFQTRYQNFSFNWVYGFKQSIIKYKTRQEDRLFLSVFFS